MPSGIARATDRLFLEEFAHATGGRARALNAVGVMAKIDLQPELLERTGAKNLTDAFLHHAEKAAE